MNKEDQKFSGLHHPSEIATVGGFESEGRLYRITVHGHTLNDRDEPHFHIYLDTEEGRDYLDPPFNFEISLVDYLSQDELNLLSQIDHEYGIEEKMYNCSWKGYEKLRREIRSFLDMRLNDKRFVCFRDNLDFMIHLWNEQHDLLFEKKGINPLKEYFTSHNIPILNKYQKYFQP